MRRGAKDYRSGCHFNAVCDVCGFKYKGNELRLQWNNIRACVACFDTRHPQDLIKGIPDRQLPPYIRDQVEPVYITMASTVASPIAQPDNYLIAEDTGDKIVDENTGEEVTF